jgi:hypothetical protein
MRRREFLAGLGLVVTGRGYSRAQIIDAGCFTVDVDENFGQCAHHQPEVCFMSDLPFIVFDVNETLLDLETMAPTFERIFGDKSAMRLWFSNLILYSAALTVAG